MIDAVGKRMTKLPRVSSLRVITLLGKVNYLQWLIPNRPRGANRYHKEASSFGQQCANQPAKLDRCYPKEIKDPKVKERKTTNSAALFD